MKKFKSHNEEYSLSKNIKLTGGKRKRLGIAGLNCNTHLSII